jgi:hypothetical protein
MSRSQTARRWLPAIAVVIVVAPHAAPALGSSDPSAELDALRKQVEELRRTDDANRKLLEEMRRKEEETARTLETLIVRIEELSQRTEREQRQPVSAAETSTPQDALEAALTETEEQPIAGAQPVETAALAARRAGGADLRLIDISMNVLSAGGWSTVGNDKLGELQAGAHDPNKRGFTLQQAELAFAGAVDPYFTAEAYLSASEDEVELEEAFGTTTGLPHGLQLEGGYFFTEFGIINPQHPHAWAWVDQPVINSRLFGGEGLRSTGFRLGWLLPIPWYSQIDWGLQSADPACCAKSFLEGSVGGRPGNGHDVNDPTDLLWLARWANSWDVGSETTAVVGLSGLYGPNSTGDAGQTWIYGLDLKLKWRPEDNFRGFPFVTWQTEIMKRDYEADGFRGTAPVDDFASKTLHDTGGYTQVLWGFRPRWGVGVRFEYAGGSNGSVVGGVPSSRNDDPTRDDRLRLSPLLTWWPSHFSRLRFQYNYDNAKHLPSDNAHTFWVALELQYGAHAAHAF